MCKHFVEGLFTFQPTISPYSEYLAAKKVLPPSVEVSTIFLIQSAEIDVLHFSFLSKQDVHATPHQFIFCFEGSSVGIARILDQLRRCFV